MYLGTAVYSKYVGLPRASSPRNPLLGGLLIYLASDFTSPSHSGGHDQNSLANAVGVLAGVGVNCHQSAWREIRRHTALGEHSMDSLCCAQLSPHSADRNTRQFSGLRSDRIFGD